MRITIHQPEHLPWLGFFHKINMADAYVVLDNVQYCRRYYQNRNKIRTKDGWRWISIPLAKGERDKLLIKDAAIFNDNEIWRKKNLESIRHSYCKSPFFGSYWNGFRKKYEKDYKNIGDFNLSLINLLFKLLGIRKEIYLASQLNTGSKQKGDLIFEICKTLGATTYISGISGKEYLPEGVFKENNIEVFYQEFHHPIYKQLYKPFIPCISVIDLLFNHGGKSLDIINGKDVPVMDELFT